MFLINLRWESRRWLPTLSTTCADGDVGVSELTLYVISGRLPLEPAYSTSRLYQKKKHANNRRSGCSLTYSVSNLRLIISTVFHTHERSKVVSYCGWVYFEHGSCSVCYPRIVDCRGRREKGECSGCCLRELAFQQFFPQLTEAPPVRIDNEFRYAVRWLGGIICLTVPVPSHNISEAGPEPTCCTIFQ